MSGVRVTVLASQLLREAAGFFEHVGEQNNNLDGMMRDNAEIYREVADALDIDPRALIPTPGMAQPPTVVELAVRLLSDASIFFENVADQNPETGEELPDTAEAYRVLAELMEQDPEARLPTDA